MSSFKPAVAFILTSLALHGALGFSMAGSWTQAVLQSIESIEIDCLPSEKTPISPKKLRGIPVPTMTPRPKARNKPVLSDFQKFIEEKMKKQEMDLARLSAEKSQPELTRPKTSAEIMADPEKGKIFVGYFSEVKKKIQKTLLERYAHRYSGRGSVTLAFVLTAQGRVEKVIVASKDEQADEILQELAVQCLRLSAPFGKFPEGLGPQKIVFNVTIFFDGK
mgnify:CR=1 FL=1